MSNSHQTASSRQRSGSTVQQHSDLLAIYCNQMDRILQAPEIKNKPEVYQQISCILRGQISSDALFMAQSQQNLITEQLAELKEHNAELKNKVGCLEDEKHEMFDRIEEVEKENNKLKSQNATLLISCEEKRVKFEALIKTKDENKSLREKNLELDEKCRRLMKYNVELVKFRRELREDNAKLKATNEKQLDKYNKLKGKNKKLKLELDKLQKPLVKLAKTSKRPSQQSSSK